MTSGNANCVHHHLLRFDGSCTAGELSINTRGNGQRCDMGKGAANSVGKHATTVPSRVGQRQCSVALATKKNTNKHIQRTKQIK